MKPAHPDLQRRALGTVLAAGLALPATAWAAPGVDEPPLPQPPRPLQLPDVAQHQLDNGLVVQVAPRPGLPLVSLTLALRAGPEADPAGRSGTAEMLAQLWPKGALRGGRPVGATDLARQAEALGSPLDARSGWGLGTLSMTVTRSLATRSPSLPA